MVTSRSACANESFPELPLLVSVPTPLQETVECSHAGLAQSPMRLPLFPLGPGMYGILCAPPPQPTVEFQLPPVLWNSSDQTPLAFKARFSGGFPSCC